MERVSRLSGALQEQLLRDTPLSGSEYAVLVELSPAPGGVLRLTDAGSAAVRDAAPEHSEAIRRYFFDPLSSDQLETLRVVFDRLLDNLAQERVTAR